MSPLDPQDFARDWIEAFNTRDLDRIMSHYAPEVELVSPLYLRFTGGLADTVRGSEALRSYFEKALERFPDLRFSLLEVAEGSGSLCIRYHTNLNDQIAMECFEREPHGAARRVACHYVSARPRPSPAQYDG